MGKIALSGSQIALTNSVGIGAQKDSGTVFTYQEKPLKDVKTTFNRARKKADLKKVRFHDLRHTFAWRLVQQVFLCMTSCT
tara:strand:- start:358 stop:600 length:243 start_codon:yes stop_codon:yes gene_type:complete